MKKSAPFLSKYEPSNCPVPKFSRHTAYTVSYIAKVVYYGYIALWILVKKVEWVNEWMDGYWMPLILL